MRNVTKIKDLDFYKDIDFDKLNKMELTPPYKPQVVKVDYDKELNNLGKPFNSFIQNEKLKAKSNGHSNRELVYINTKKSDNFFNLHVNQMKWYDKF